MRSQNKSVHNQPKYAKVGVNERTKTMSNMKTEGRERGVGESYAMPKEGPKPKIEDPNRGQDKKKIAKK